MCMSLVSLCAAFGLLGELHFIGRLTKVFDNKSAVQEALQTRFCVTYTCCVMVTMLLKSICNETMVSN